ncbi:MAG: DinB family protein [Chloroflexota bacterium]
MSTEKTQLWKSKLAESQNELLTLIESLTPEQWDVTVFSEGAQWSVLSTLRHLAESERGMSIQIHKIRKGGPTIPENFDLNRWNAGTDKRMAEFSANEIVATLQATRTKTIEVMESLQDEDWSKEGRHPSQEIYSIEQYYGIIHGHQLAHAQDIRNALGIGE